MNTETGISIEEATHGLRSLQRSLQEADRRDMKPTPAELYEFKKIFVLLQIAGHQLSTVTWDEGDPTLASYPWAFQVLPQVEQLMSQIGLDPHAYSQREVVKEPLVFMSYDTDDIDLVRAIDDTLQRVLNKRVKTFIAKRDIQAGDDAFKKMLHENLAKCAVVLALCTKRSVTSPWLWFESGAGFEKSGLIPIWSGVNPLEFKAPMTIFQGKNIKDKVEIHELFSKIAEVTKIDIKDITITDEEFENLVKISEKLDATSSKNESNRIEGLKVESNLADINVGFEKKEITSTLHTYSLSFSVKWQGPRDQDFFNISLLWPKAIKINKIRGFERGEDEEIDGILYEELSLFVDKRLWPHKTTKAVGGKASAQLEYIFDNSTYTKVHSDVPPKAYKLYYKFYSQEWPPISGELSFKDLNVF